MNGSFYLVDFSIHRRKKGIVYSLTFTRMRFCTQWPYMHTGTHSLKHTIRKHLNSHRRWQIYFLSLFFVVFIYILLFYLEFVCFRTLGRMHHRNCYSDSISKLRIFCSVLFLILLGAFGLSALPAQFPHKTHNFDYFSFAQQENTIRENDFDNTILHMIFGTRLAIIVHTHTWSWLMTDWFSVFLDCQISHTTSKAEAE